MKAKVYRENGYYFNSRTGEQYLWQDDAPATRRAMRRGEKKPSFCYKLRRFVRRFGRLCGRAMERVQALSPLTAPRDRAKTAAAIRSGSFSGSPDGDAPGNPDHLFG